MLLKKIFLRILQYILLIKKLIVEKSLLLLSNLYQVIFLLFNKTGLEKEVKINKRTLESVKKFIDEDTYSLSSDYYGLPPRILKHIDKPYNKYPTYSDLILYLLNSFSKPPKYVEVGVSVLKNFYLISSGKTGIELYAYDINKINTTIEKYFLLEDSQENIKKYVHNGNKIAYFQGDVFSTKDLNNFKDLIKKVNFIFSDAHHSYEGLMSEYENLIKEILNKEFIIYYDDLSGELKKAFLEISDNLSKEHHIYTFTFLINGWVGNHEKMHRNGIITNLNLTKSFSKDGVKLLSLKHY